MVLEKKADVLHAPNRLCLFVCLFALFVTYFLLILYIMLPLPSLMTENNFWTSGLRLFTTDWQNLFFSFNESDKPYANDILLSREQTQIPMICMKRRWRKRDCPLRIRRLSNEPPLPSILLASVQPLENKINDLRGRLNYQWDIKKCYLMFHGVVAERCHYTAGWSYAAGRIEQQCLVRQGAEDYVFL